jgi:heat shock protein HspQ
MRYLTSLRRHAFKATRQRAAGAYDVASKARTAKFTIGQVVRHRIHPFRGVVFDVDPVFDNTEEWWMAIPEDHRPTKDQPYYHLLAENEESEYIAYVSEQNLLADDSGEPLRHPQLGEFFAGREGDIYIARDRELN